MMLHIPKLEEIADTLFKFVEGRMDRTAFEKRTGPQPIPGFVRQRLSALMDEISGIQDYKEIRHLIEVFRLTADPVTNNYLNEQSNEQIRLLNERLAEIGYSTLQIAEYQNAH